MIAVPITAATLEEALKDIKDANKKADFIELRLDFLKEVNETVLRELMQHCKKPVIVTYRDKNFGAAVEQTERMFLLRKAVELGAAFIDLDFDSDRGFIEDFSRNKGNTKLIVSHHDFEETPALQQLMQLLAEMAALQCDVLKVVTFANTQRDNETILALLHAAKPLGKPMIAFCMGPKGIKSRIRCIKAGAMLTFASLGKGKESAEGQLGVEEMRKGLAK